MRRALLAGSVAVLGIAAGLADQGQPAARATAVRATSTPGLTPLLGFLDSRLVRVDHETLRPIRGKALAVGSGGCAARSGGTACWSNPAWTVSPNGARLAFARNDTSSLQVADPTRLRVTTRVEFDGGSIGALAWPVPRRLIAVQEAIGERQRVIAFDLGKKRVVVRRALNGTVTRLARTARGFVLLLAPAERIGEARIAVVDSRGAVRFASVPRILLGTKLLGTGNEHRVDSRQPGLAVDEEGQRAVVVADDLVAEVNLRTLEVAYRELQRPRSLLSRLWSWLEPAAAAKQVNGYHRRAEWLGDDLVAVSGSDSDGGRQQPAGLELLDTRAWTTRMVDSRALDFEIADDALVATGWRWDSSGRNAIGTGLAAYRLDGTERFRLFDGDHAWLAEVYDGRAYVTLAAAQDRLRIVDLEQGVVTGLREPVLPALLLGSGAGWWD
jgi:hypothetical protein